MTSNATVGFVVPIPTFPFIYVTPVPFGTSAIFPVGFIKTLSFKSPSHPITNIPASVPVALNTFDDVKEEAVAILSIYFIYP